MQGCHDFLAGDALRSKSRFKALDETAIFGRACRHEFPKHFINLKHGEKYAITALNAMFKFDHTIILSLYRLSYAVYCLQKLQQKKNDQSIVLLYDIACLLEKHIKVGQLHPIS